MPFTATRILFLRCLARNQIVSSNNQINILATHPSVCLGHRNVVCVFFRKIDLKCKLGPQKTTDAQLQTL